LPVIFADAAPAMISCRQTNKNVTFTVRVVPRASRSEIVGTQDDAVKLRISSPPVEGKANEECVRVIADFLGLKKRQVSIVSGHASRTKTIALTGTTLQATADQLNALPSLDANQPELPGL